MVVKAKGRRKRVTIIRVYWEHVASEGELWKVSIRPPFGRPVWCASYKRKSDAMNYANKWEAELNDAEYDVEGD